MDRSLSAPDTDTSPRKSRLGSSPMVATVLIISRIFSVLCDGKITAGILGGAEFQFEIVNNNAVARNVPRHAKKGRQDVPVPKGYYALPITLPKLPTGNRCPTADQTAVSKNPSPPLEPNGCGPAGPLGDLVPELDFTPCCNNHDLCYGITPLSSPLFSLTFPPRLHPKARPS
jgi:hypothetical protein